MIVDESDLVAEVRSKRLPAHKYSAGGTDSGDAYTQMFDD